MVQTDWSGGPSGETTTTEWGSNFGSCFGMGWQTPGVLTLGRELTWWRVQDDGYAHALRSANANNDQYTDLFRCSYSSIYAVFAFGSQNPWWKFSVGSTDSVYTFFPGDLNGDGRDDVLGGSDSLYWWENPENPDWNWQIRLVDDISAFGGAVVDYDKDGKNDIICLEPDWGDDVLRLLCYKNLGEGLVWDRIVLFETGNAFGGDVFTLQDIEGDGYLTATIFVTSPMGVGLVRDSQSGWSHVETIRTYCDSWPMFVDLDNDGAKDYIGSRHPYSGGRIRWHRGPDYNQFFTLEAGETIYGLTCIDFDEDGDMDIAYRTGNTVGVFENTRAPLLERFIQRVLMEYPFENGLDPESAGGLVAPGDFDGDGVDDFVCSFHGFSDPDLYWWHMGEGYRSAGWLNSQILYVHDAAWGELSWEESDRADGQIYFHVRGSDDPSDLGEWSELICGPADLSDYLEEGDSYMQYRVVMLGVGSNSTPELHSVTVTYDPLGIEENPELRLSVSPSPAATTANIRLSLPDPVDCTVSMYGLDGRLVERLHGGSLPAGENSFHWDVSSVPSGVYFVRVAGAGVDSSARVAVVR